MFKSYLISQNNLNHKWILLGYVTYDTNNKYEQSKD